MPTRQLFRDLKPRRRIVRRETRLRYQQYEGERRAVPVRRTHADLPIDTEDKIFRNKL